MKKVIKFIAELGLLTGLILLFTHLTAIAGYLPIPGEAIQEFESKGIPGPHLIDTDQPLDGLGMAKTLVLNTLSYVKVIVVVVAILYITIMGYRLVVSSDEEETVTEAKRGMIYALVALAILSMGEDIGRIFDMEKTTLLSSPQEILNRVHLFDKQVEIIVTFLKYVIGSYAVLMIVRSGAMLIMAGGNEEETSKHKNSIYLSATGLLLIYVGDVFINKVFYKIDKNVYSGLTGVHPTVDPQEGVSQLIGITNFIISFVGPLAVLMLLIGAIMYATAGGEEENMNRAKRVLITTGVGIVIIFAAFAIVSTVISGQLGNAGALIEQ